MSEPDRIAEYERADCPICEEPNAKDYGSVDGAMHEWECRSCRARFCWPATRKAQLAALDLPDHFDGTGSAT